MAINKNKLANLSIADLFALMKNAEGDMTEALRDSQRLPDDEEAKEKYLFYWREYTTFSSEFQKRIQDLST